MSYFSQPFLVCLRDFIFVVKKRTLAGTHLRGTAIFQKHNEVELSANLQEGVVDEISTHAASATSQLTLGIPQVALSGISFGTSKFISKSPYRRKV